jgi:hypothetical protein
MLLHKAGGEATSSVYETVDFVPILEAVTRDVRLARNLALVVMNLVRPMVIVVMIVQLIVIVGMRCQRRQSG